LPTASIRRHLPLSSRTARCRSRRSWASGAAWRGCTASWEGSSPIADAFADDRRISRVEASTDVPSLAVGNPSHGDLALGAARATVSQCLDATSQAQTAVLEAARERKVLEELKRRRLAEFAAREARKEERELDEANLAAWQTSRRAAAP